MATDMGAGEPRADGRAATLTAETAPASAWGTILNSATAIIADEEVVGTDRARRLTPWAAAVAVLVDRSIHAALVGERSEFAGVLPPDALAHALRRLGEDILKAQVGWLKRPDAELGTAAVVRCLNVITDAIPSLDDAAQHRELAPDMAAVAASSLTLFQARADKFVPIPAGSIVAAARLLIRGQLPRRVGAPDVIAVMRSAALDAVDGRAGSLEEVRRSLRLADALLTAHMSLVGVSPRSRIAQTRHVAHGLVTLLPQEPSVPGERPKRPDLLPTSAWPEALPGLRRSLLVGVGRGGLSGAAGDDFTWWMNAVRSMADRAEASGYRPLMETALSTIARALAEIERARPLIVHPERTAAHGAWSLETGLGFIRGRRDALTRRLDRLNGAHGRALASLLALDDGYLTGINRYRELPIDPAVVGQGLLEQPGRPQALPSEAGPPRPALTDVIQGIAIQECVLGGVFPPSGARLLELLERLRDTLRLAADTLVAEFPERRLHLDRACRRLGRIHLGLDLLTEAFKSATSEREANRQLDRPNLDVENRLELMDAAWWACAATLHPRVGAASAEAKWRRFHDQLEQVVSLATPEAHRVGRGLVGLGPDGVGAAHVIHAAITLSAPELRGPRPVIQQDTAGVVSPQPEGRARLRAAHERLVAELARLQGLTDANPAGWSGNWRDAPQMRPSTPWQATEPPPGWLGPSPMQPRAEATRGRLTTLMALDPPRITLQ